MKGNANGKSTKPVRKSTERKPNTKNVPVSAASTRRDSKTRGIPVSKSSQRKAASVAPKNQNVSPRVRRDWRRSELTTFVLGLCLLGIVVVVVASHSPYKSWMPLVTLVLGIGYAFVFLLGGEQ